MIALKPDWPAMLRGYGTMKKFTRRNLLMAGIFAVTELASMRGYFWFVGRDDIN